MDRRKFIKGLMAAAVASQVPFTLAQAERVPTMLVNGLPPNSIEDAGNGWYRLIWVQSHSDTYSFEPPAEVSSTFVWGPQLEATKEEDGPITISLYAKIPDG
jgi:hypothetical protein